LLEKLVVVNKNIIASMILSLKEKGVIKKIKKEKKSLFKEVLTVEIDEDKEKDLNSGEKKIINIFKDYGKTSNKTGNIITIEFDPNSLSNSEKREINSELQSLSNFLEKRMSKNLLGFLMFLSIILSIFLLKFLSTFTDSLFLFFIPVLNVGFVISINDVLVKFKNEEYWKEFLEVKSFKRFLEDLANMKKYYPEDVIIWKDWLLTATALGVADKVMEVMKKEGILDLKELTEIEESVSSSIVLSSAISTASSSGSSGGGGGFGGGGGGAR
jgi:uncharacterized membrane protein